MNKESKDGRVLTTKILQSLRLKEEDELPLSQNDDDDDDTMPTFESHERSIAFFHLQGTHGVNLWGHGIQKTPILLPFS